jgi:voltage-gated potassium channel
VNERARELERRLQWPMLVAALLVVPAIVIEQSEAGGLLNTIAVVINWLTWLAFLAEAALMLRVVDDRWRWIRDHPLEVAIVLVTPPFLPPSLQAARIFRLLRLLPLLRAGLLARRLLTTEGVRDVAVLALLTVLGGGAAYAAVETDQDLSTWDGVWWAVVTVTTVGYGDTFPTTEAGRAIAVVVMLVGIGFLAVLTAAAAERFMRGREAEQQRAELQDRLDEIAARLAALEGSRDPAGSGSPRGDRG